MRALLVLATSRMEPGWSRIGAIGSLIPSIAGTGKPLTQLSTTSLFTTIGNLYLFPMAHLHD